MTSSRRRVGVGAIPLFDILQTIKAPVGNPHRCSNPNPASYSRPHTYKHRSNWDATLISFLTAPPAPNRSQVPPEGPGGGWGAVAAAVCLHGVLISGNSDLTGSVEGRRDNGLL